MKYRCFPALQLPSNRRLDILINIPAGIQFKYIVLFDEKNKRAATYQIPDLPEIDCLDEDSEIAKDRITIMNGILRGDRTREEPIFRLKGAEGRHIMANLEKAPIGAKSGVWQSRNLW